MNGELPILVLLLGATVIGAVLLRALCHRLGIPALVGYVLIGVFLSAIDGGGGIMTPNALLVFEFLGGVGIVALLFRVGLESNIVEMLAQLRSAVWVWIGNVGLSGLLGFAVTYWLLGFSLVPSLFIATALTATSLGVCLGVWREADALDTPAGGLLIDVAELDDLSGIAAMILLFAAAPVLLVDNGGVAATLGRTLLEFLVKLAVFGAFCVLFARYVEAPISRFFSGLKPPPDPLLPVVGATFVIAAFAGWLGFSLAVGALFAGLLFSRDPRAVHTDASFSSIYDFFTPFFFINIGLALDPAILNVAGLGIAGLLLAVAIVGKVVGTAVPARLLTGGVVGGWHGALLIGISMVPRAEIAMVVMSEGRLLGDWAVPPELFSAMVLVVLVTSVVAPLVIARILAARPLQSAGAQLNRKA
jgi:Kef-type K+ transport system membrane component KefB